MITLFIPTWMTLISYIKGHGDSSISQISYNTKISYAQCYNIIRLFEEKNIVSIPNNNSRDKLVKITIKGKNLCDNVDQILKRLK